MNFAGRVGDGSVVLIKVTHRLPDVKPTADVTTHRSSSSSQTVLRCHRNGAAAKRPTSLNIPLRCHDANDELLLASDAVYSPSINTDVKLHATTSDTVLTVPTRAVSMKHSSRRAFKELMLSYAGRRRKSRDVEAIGQLFGRDLDEICHDGKLPPSLTSLMECLWVYGPRTEGVFRHCASVKTCRKWRSALDSGYGCLNVDSASVHVAAGLLKELLRKLPDCVLGCDLYEDWLGIADMTPADAVPAIKSMISQLTANQRLLLHHVTLVLRNINAHKSVTRMTSINLAVCITPALIWRTQRASRLFKTGDEHMIRDAGKLAVVVQRIIDAEYSALFGTDLDHSTPFADVISTSLESSSFDDLEPAECTERYTDMRLSTQLSEGDLPRYSSPSIDLTQLVNSEQMTTPVPPPRTKKLRRQSCFAAITYSDTALSPEADDRRPMIGSAAVNVGSEESLFRNENEATLSPDNNDVIIRHHVPLTLSLSASFDQQSWMDIQSDAPRSSNSLPTVWSSRDQPDRKSGMQQQQSTDSAISVSLDDTDDILSTPSSTSSRLSLLQLHATPTSRCDVTRADVTPTAMIRRGMTTSGDDLFPARMRNSLVMSTYEVDDDFAIIKCPDKGNKPTNETDVIHAPLEQPTLEQEERVSMSQELESRHRMNALRHLNNYQRYIYKDEDSEKSTSDDYTSDYEDSRTRWRWRDDSVTKPVGRRNVHQRRSYSKARRRHEVKRSHSDSVHAKYRTGRETMNPHWTSNYETSDGYRP